MTTEDKLKKDFNGMKPCTHKKKFYGMVSGRCIKCGGYISSLGKNPLSKKKKKPSNRIMIVQIYIEKSKRTSGWSQLLARDIDGNDWVITGSYCGGIPESHWEKLQINKDLYPKDLVTSKEITET